MDPVVVVGAGPTGLMLAGELRCAGVETILLERLAEPSGQSRALALHARSAELLEQRGLLGPFLAEGVTWPYIHFAGLKLDMDRLDGRHRYSLHVHQSRVEALLEEAAGKRGADIRRGHAVTGLDQDDGEVEVTVATATGGYRLRCAYLVGCDGGASTVRKLAGIEFPGTASTLWGVLGDVECFDAPVAIREPLVSARGMFGVSPLDDRLYRLMCIETDAPAPGDEEPTAGELRAMIQRVLGLDVTFAEPRWLSRFGDATRLVTRYRQGRVFLAGDAAHIHFPLAAQGMNTGIQDAANLGWKLAAAVHGFAPPGLLDTYHDERHAVGERVCALSRAQIALSFPADRMAPVRDLLSELIGFDTVHAYLVRMMSGADVRYPVPGSGADELLGRRLPDADLRTPAGETTVLRTLHGARGVLLDLSGGAALTGAVADWTDRVDLVVADPIPDLPGTALLCRPDGHLVWRGDTGGELGLALETWFGPRCSEESS